MKDTKNFSLKVIKKGNIVCFENYGDNTVLVGWIPPKKFKIQNIFVIPTKEFRFIEDFYIELEELIFKFLPTEED